MGDSPLQRAATLDRLQFLRDRGALSAEQHRAGAWWVAGPPTASTWRRLLDVVALTLGAALIVAGVVYVLVWNWTELGRLTRILLALAPVIAAGGVAFWKGTDSLPGQVAASSGAVLVFAPLIAVGLAYPSGGELWSLLAIWTALCVPWAISARFAPAWFIVLGAADATIISALSEVGDPNDPAATYAVLGVHAVVWLVFEGLRRAKVPWVLPWSCYALLVPVQGLLTVVTIWWVVGGTSTPQAIAVALIFVVSSVVAQVLFMQRRLHPFVAVVNVMALVSVAIAAIGRMQVILSPLLQMWELLAVPFGLVMLLVLALAGVWIGVGLRRRALEVS